MNNESWPSGPSVEDVKAIQRQLNLLDVHVVWLGPEHFVLAHTDDERASGDLYCELHCWLRDVCDGPPEAVGYYVVTPHEVDAYEPYPVARFDFVPCQGLQGREKHDRRFLDE